MLRELREHPRLWQRRLKFAASERIKTNVSKYSKLERSIVMTMIAAKQRCVNPKGVGYERYGGRGIMFLFESVEDATRWVAANLGPRPSKHHSIDRIDNNRHYEPGNLRWATAAEQNRNKRAYQRTPEGERLRRLAAIRTDYTEVGLMRYIKRGWTDEQIIAMEKPPGGRPRKC
jgi:hypothetical protein